MLACFWLVFDPVRCLTFGEFAENGKDEYSLDQFLQIATAPSGTPSFYAHLTQLINVYAVPIKPSTLVIESVMDIYGWDDTIKERVVQFFIDYKNLPRNFIGNL